ncbi:VIT1/CCC1 transporter family protein [Alicyclobacillus contaminans]|uniref:VIT1/CCC1 transporter family protein n=1 Tax=Alicyclobacillus contaminans TaxID=392016 RepID=UPI000409D24F|nr:VIT1/CCC1 transporter family protein [Alicyclobacillus contaminans]
MSFVFWGKRHGTCGAAFGFVKGKFTGVNAYKSALQTALVGGLAAGAAFLLAKLFSA